MANIAQLGFGADTSQLKKAETDLRKLPPAANQAEKSADKLGKEFDELSRSTDRATNSQNRFVPQVKRASDVLDQGAKRGGAFSKAMGLISGSARGAAGVLGTVVGQMIAFGAASFAIGSVISTLASFESQMSAVKAVSRATGDELAAMRDVAKDLGSSTEFSASQVAEGLKFLSMAGFEAKESIAAIPAVLDLATAAAMDLGQAADITSNIMGGFGISAENATDVADVLAAASSRANTDVSQLGQAMSTVAPISKTLGISLADTAAAIGVMSDAGIQAERAGTAMRGAMAALASPTKAAREALAKYGIEADKVNPATNDLADVLDRLKPLAKDAGAAMQVFGREAASGALVLIEGAGRVREFGTELEGVSGEAATMAGYMRDNLGGSINGVKSAIEGLIIAMGEAGLTALIRAVIDIATGFVRVLTDIVNVIGMILAPLDVLTPALQFLGENFQQISVYATAAALVYTAQFIPALIAATGSAIAAGAAFAVQMAGGLLATATAATTASGALVLLRGALVKTGIGAIVVLIGYAINKLIDLTEKTGSLGDAFKALGQIAAATWDAIVTSAGAIPPALQGVWNVIKREFYQLIVDLMNQWYQFLGSLGAAARGIGLDGLAESLGGAARAAGEKMDPLIDKVYELDGAAKDSFGQSAKIISGAMDQLSIDANIASMGLGELSDKMPGTASAVDNTTTSVQDLADALGSLGDTDAGSGGGGAAKAGGGASKALTELEKIKGALDKLSEPFDQAGAAVQAAKSAMENGIITNDAYAASLQKIQTAFMAAGGSADQWAKIMEGNTETVAQQLENLGKNSIVSLGENISQLATGGAADFKEFARSLIQQMINIAIQALIVKPLLSSLGFANGGAIDGGGQVSVAGYAAGGAFDSSRPSVTAFAAGGTFTNSIVNSPTPFAFGGGSLGVMGEAGPEAIMPLQRGPDGSLGVQVHGTGAAVDSGPQRVALDVRVSAEEGKMFRPVVQDIVREDAGAMIVQAQEYSDAQLPEKIAQFNRDDRVR